MVGEKNGFWGSYDFYAFSNGVANLVFTTIDGVAKTLPVVVNAPDSPRILWQHLTSPVADNSGTQTNYASWQVIGSASSKSVNISSMVINYDVSWNNPVMVSLSPAAGADPGSYIITFNYAASWGSPVLGEAAVQLTVMNASARGQIAGTRYIVAGGGGQMMDGTMEVYDLAGKLVASKDIWDPMKGDYLMSFLLPGSYKVRFVPRRYSMAPLAPVWYPNGLSFNEAAPVQVQAGKTTDHINFYLMRTADEILPAPSVSGSVLSFAIPSRSGIHYFLEATDDLGSHLWTTMQTAVGIGGSLTITNDLGTARKRFYRLRME
jgi:hypothetical protein